MEGIGVVKELLFFFQTLGPWGIVGFLWWDGRRDFQKFKEILYEENKKWGERFLEVKEMYEKNVELVRNYNRLAGDQQDVIILNTQAVTKLTTIIETRGVYES